MQWSSCFAGLLLVCCLHICCVGGDGAEPAETGTCDAKTCGDKGVAAKENKASTLPACAQPMGHLGELPVDLDVQPLARVRAELSWVKPGGRWAPRECRPSQRVAVIVPYRDRSDDRSLFLRSIHPFLAAQMLHYTVYLVEQKDEKHFNRGALLNVGYLEGMKRERFDCVIFHDIDKFPEDTRNLYLCTDQPTHLVGKIRYKNNKYRVRDYDNYFGGVNAISSAQFEQINGYANMFWGWGSEDDDFLLRIKLHGLKTARSTADIGKYSEIWHPYGFVNPRRHDVVNEGKARYATDGLSSMNYKVLSITKRPLYTHIEVNLLHTDPYPMK